MKYNSILWLLLALIFGSYSGYILSSAHGDSLAITAGVVLVAGSLVALWKFLRDTRASKVDRNDR